MKKKKVNQSEKNIAYKTVLIILICLLIVLVGNIWIFKKKNNEINRVKYFEDFSSENKKTYVSEKLGVKFDYLENQPGGGTKYQIKEIGSKIFLFDSLTDKPEDGQYVEVFMKNKSESFEEAIRKRILSKYSPKDCFVKSKLTYDDLVIKIRDNFNYAQISFPINENSTGQEPWWSTSKCPGNYTSIGGLSYFIEDKNYSERFAFVSVGQYAIFANKDYDEWHETIEFLK